MSQNVSKIRLPNLKIIIALVCVAAALFIVPAQIVHAKHGFQLQINLRDGNSDSGKVKVFVLSETTNSKKSKSLDVGRITSRTGDGNIENLIFRFTDRQLPPNGAFSACAVSKIHGTQCEEADRHYDATSAVMWVQVPH